MNVYKECCSLERSFFPTCIPIYTHMLVCSSAPLKGLFHVLTLPFLSSLSRFSCFASTPLQRSFCLPCFSLSFLSWFSVQMSALSYLFARAQSNVLHPLFTSVSTKLPDQLCFSTHPPFPTSNQFFFICTLLDLLQHPPTDILLLLHIRGATNNQ